MAHRSKKLRVVAAVAVCSLGLTSPTTPPPEGDGVVPRSSLFVAAASATPGGPEDLYLYPKEQNVPHKEPGGPSKDAAKGSGGAIEKKKRKMDVKIKFKRQNKEKRLRKRRVEDSDDDEGLSPAEQRRNRLQKALNIFGMLAEAILNFTECFGENGPLQKLKTSFAPAQGAKNVFRGEGNSDDVEAEEVEAPAPTNCALGAIMKAAALFEGDESRPVTRALEAAVASGEEPSYFVVDSNVLVDQAWELAGWVSAKVEEVRSELAVLRVDAESSDSEEDEPDSIVAVRESPTSRIPSPWTIMTPDEPADESISFDVDENLE